MKERLTGAIILVALIVLLVPELLTGPIRSSPRAAAASAEEAPLRSYTINLSDDSRAHAGALASGPEQPIPLPAAAPPAPPPETTPAAPAAAPSAAPSTPAKSAPPKSAPPMPAKSAAKAAAKPAADPPAGATAGAWMVQLGSFASRANAERLAQRVRDGGFKVSVAQGRSGRHLFRVLVGPARDRAGASQLAAKLQAAGHSGSIVSR